MSFIFKSLVSLGALGAIGTASYGAWSILGSEKFSTIQEKLESQNKKKAIDFSSESSTNAWETKKTEYGKSASTEEEKILSKNDAKSDSKLREKCKEILEKKIAEDNKKEEIDWASKWCFSS